MLWLLWLLLPPHADNIGVVDYLHRSARRRAGTSSRLAAPQLGSLASSDEPVGRWAAPEDNPSRSDVREGLWCRTLSSARAQSLRLVYHSLPGAHEPARRVLRSATERHDRSRGAERGRAIDEGVDGSIDGSIGRSWVEYHLIRDPNPNQVTLHATLQNGIFSAHPPSTRVNVRGHRQHDLHA